MHYYLRFRCYDDPSRQSSTQIHPDILVDGPMGFDYGQSVTVGPDEDDPATWPQYVVASITRMSQIDDPARPGKNALLFEVHVARESQWPEFEVPQVIREIWQEKGEKAD